MISGLKGASAAEAAWKWCRKELRPAFSEVPNGTPSLEHCVGTRRLGGLLYADYLRHYSSVADADYWEDIARAFALLRGGIVLHDCVVDGALVGSAAEGVLQLRDMLHSRALRFCSHLAPPGEAHSLLSRSSQMIRDAYSALDSGSPPTRALVVAKCNHFRVPLQLIGMRDASFPERVLDDALSDYLFILQCLDDFHDMEEDFESSTNHNLFVWGMEQPEFELMLGIRTLVLPALARFLADGAESTRLRMAGSIGSSGRLGALLARTRDELTRFCRRATLRRRIPLWFAGTSLGDFVPPRLEPDWMLSLSDIPSAPRPPAPPGDFRAEPIHSLAESVLVRGW